MGIIRTPLPVKLFLGILTSAPAILNRVEERLAGIFGSIDLKSELFSFVQTHYYDEEMGTPIFRCFLSFTDLIDASAIGQIKARTNELEAEFAGAQRRPVNLDPGYLEQSKIVLASTKNFSHRILISDGIYAEVTLLFKDGKWCDLPWTFPDYKSDRYHRYFSDLRKLYRNQLKAAGFPVRV